MIFIVCQRVILTCFSAKPEIVARLCGHDRFFVMYREIYLIINNIVIDIEKNKSKINISVIHVCFIVNKLLLIKNMEHRNK